MLTRRYAGAFLFAAFDDIARRMNHLQGTQAAPQRRAKNLDPDLRPKSKTNTYIHDPFHTITPKRYAQAGRTYLKADLLHLCPLLLSVWARQPPQAKG